MTEMGIPKNVIIFGAAMSCMEKCSRADIGFQLIKKMMMIMIATTNHEYKYLGSFEFDKVFENVCT